MRITLNLATRPFADLGPAIERLRIGMAVLAALAIGLGLGLHAIHRKAEAARAREHSLDGQIARITQERQNYTNLMHQPENTQVLVEAGVLNKLFDEKGFSWTLAMEDLETVLPGGVQVTTLEPARDKFGKISVRLKVQGPRDREVDLVRNLEHSRRFLLPRIVGENSADTSNGLNQRLQPVSASDRFDFDLLADYNPATPEERKATRKPSSHSENAAESAAPASHAIHPLPLAPVPSEGAQPHIRPPYTGPAQAMPPDQPRARPMAAPAPGGPQ